MHAYAKDERWNHKIANPITGQPMTATNEQSHMQATFAEMKKYNIVKAFVSTERFAILRQIRAFLSYYHFYYHYSRVITITHRSDVLALLVPCQRRTTSLAINALFFLQSI
jgi:hypothetical protein